MQERQSAVGAPQVGCFPLTQATTLVLQQESLGCPADFCQRPLRQSPLKATARRLPLTAPAGAQLSYLRRCHFLLLLRRHQQTQRMQPQL